MKTNVASQEMPEPTSPTEASDNLSVGALAAMFQKRISEGPGPSGSPSPAGNTPEPSGHTPEEPEVEGKPTDAALQEPSPQTVASKEEDAGEGDSSSEKAERATREFEYPKFQKRIDELTARLRQAEEALSQLKSGKGEPSEPDRRGDTATMPVEELESLSEVEQRLAAAQAVVEIQAANPEGYTFRDEKGNEKELSPEDLRRMASRALQDMARLTARRELLLERQRMQQINRIQAQIEQDAAEYPWLKQPESAQYQQALRLVQEHPSLLRHPNVVRLVAGAVEALERPGRRVSGTPGGTRNARPPTSMTARPSGVPASDGENGRLNALKRQFEETGRVNDLQQLLAEKYRSRQVV